VATLALAVLAPAAPAAGPLGTARALAAQMRAAGAGSGALAVDLDTGAQIYSRRASTPRMPASVQKLYTAAATLRRLGASGRLVTTVSALAAPDPAGVVRSDLYLRGGGDPTFDARDAAGLAQRLVDEGITEVRGRVLGDETAFDTLRGVPSSGFQLTSEVGPLSALTFNRGRSGLRSPFWQRRPANFAATAFTKQLRRLGIAVARTARPGVTPPDAVQLGAWRSQPVNELLRQMNQPSDNFIAEMLVKVLGANSGAGGTTAAGTAVIRQELTAFGIAPQVVDGSGLSRDDRTSPRDVVALLTALDGDAAFAGSLPIAGRNGTLSTRMRGTVAQDRCRAKTGTLRDASALAGYCTTTAGGAVAFAYLMNGVTPWRARILQDRMTVALTKYRPTNLKRDSPSSG
jgi:D-alanyl-D-alanine carboxypeptidase/D-alanyl-D-alanine-endopeptidase (penicillin-binding protein 4)